MTSAAATLSCVSALITIVNAVSMRRMRVPVARTATESVVVCVPARDEERDLPRLISDLRAQQYDGALRILILDDGSSDRTSAVADAAVGADRRFTIVTADNAPPAGWTGKAAACQTLADLAFDLYPDVDVIAFVDADVRLAEGAIAAAVTARRDHDAALLCPWPEQVSRTVAERLVQPLLGFSWMSTLPVRLANRSLRPSTAVACGQMMVFDAAAYREIGGHASVASSATEDLDIARVLRRAGRTTAVVSGAGFVSCRMYDGWAELSEGYSRWLWTAFGGRAASAATGTALTVTYVIPPLAAMFGSGPTRRAGLIGYAAAVASRTVAAQAESGFDATRIPESAAAASTHPLSVAAYLCLTLDSHRRHARGQLTWKRRPLVMAGSDAGR